MSSRLVVTLALVSAALATAGCGGSSKTASTSAVTNAKSEEPTKTTATPPAKISATTVQIATGQPLPTTLWIAKGDAICLHYNKQIEVLEVKKASELPRILPQEAAYVRAEIARLAKLVPPTSKKSEWQLFLNKSSEWAEGMTQISKLTSLGDAITRAPVTQTTIAIHNHVMTVARQAGFKHCSQV